MGTVSNEGRNCVACPVRYGLRPLNILHWSGNKPMIQIGCRPCPRNRPHLLLKFI